MNESLRAAFERGVLRMWFGPDTAATRTARKLLTPLSALVAHVARSRRLRVDRRADASRPAVVVVGNLVAGGAGKTPVVIALARALRTRGWRPGVIARGYRAGGRGARRVGPDDDADSVGDEPLLVARRTGLPVAAGIERTAALALLAADCDVVVSDDGLQHVELPRDVEIAVFDRRGAGNGRTLPAGPLREPLAALAGMDALLLNGTDRVPWPHPRVFRGTTRPTVFVPLADDGLPVDADGFARLHAGRRVAALAGIAAPTRFFDTLASLGFRDMALHPLPDHARIDPAWLRALDAELVLMTEKDAVKCRAFADDRCWALRVEAVLPPALVDLVADRLAAAGHAPAAARPSN